MNVFSKQVAVRAESGADELKLVLHDAVDQDKIRLNMAIAVSGVVAGKRMVSQTWRKRLLGSEKINDCGNLFEAFASLDSKLKVARELLSEDSGKHNGQSSMSSADLSISSVLSNGPYDGSRPAMSRSRTARVSALGMCSSFSGTCIGNGKPRCSRVCMSRMFMPVDVDMPRREKRSSACCLTSGFTRNAIVAEFIDDCFLLFNNSEHCITFAYDMQVGDFTVGDFKGGQWGHRLAA